MDYGELFGETRKHALNVMKAKADKLGIQGVAAIVFVSPSSQSDEIIIWHKVVGRFHRPPDVEGRGDNDTGTNYLAVVDSKIAQTIRTRVASGETREKLPYGENPHRGAIRTNEPNSGGIFIITAFSGGTEDQDVEIATAGLEAISRTPVAN